jgi:HdeA/HdeB family
MALSGQLNPGFNLDQRLFHRLPGSLGMRVGTIAAIVLGLMVFEAKPSYALGVGSQTCGQYLKISKRGRGPIHHWVLGYATGANQVGQIVYRQDFLAGTNQQDIFRKLTDFCKQHPTMRLQEGARDFLAFIKGGGRTQNKDQNKDKNRNIKEDTPDEIMRLEAGAR